MACASVNVKFNVEVINMCIVPIKISHQNCKKTIRTYAMLDNCSQGSFIKQDLLKRLGVDGQKLNLSEFENTYWRKIKRNLDGR